MEVDGNHLLGTEACSKGSETFHARDPATGERLEPAYPEATQAEVDHALVQAEAASAWFRRSKPELRAAFLAKIADQLEELAEALLLRAEAETALPHARLEMELGRTCSQLRMFTALLEEGSWVEARIDHGQPDLRQMLTPLGPVVVFGASNFPLAFSVAGGDTASALAAGCPVVVKAHPNHPGTSELAGRAIVAAVLALGMPKGSFSLLHGRSEALGRALVSHPSTRAVAFTGSFKGGRALLDVAQSRLEPIPFHAEMGSVNPVFLLPGALAEHGGDLARCLAESLLLGVGQFCTNPGLVIVRQDGASERFLAEFRRVVAAAAPQTMLHDGLRQAYEGEIGRRQTQEGVTLLEGGPSGTGTTVRAACFLVDAETFLSQPSLADELFGPATLIVRCQDEAGLLEVAHNLQGQLTATVHGSRGDLDGSRELLAILETKVGRLLLGGFPTGVRVCPSMHHGGPYPATSDARWTSVGSTAIHRFLRPLCYQDFPDDFLPEALVEDNPRGILRLVDGQWTRAPGKPQARS